MHAPTHGIPLWHAWQSVGTALSRLYLRDNARNHVCGVILYPGFNIAGLERKRPVRYNECNALIITLKMLAL